MSNSRNPEGKETMNSSGENRRARRERGQILFLEMNGELVSIDLSGDGGSSSQILSLPPFCCRLDLRKNGYPVGMRHAKIGDKHYLLGGAIKTEEFHPVEYSDKVYELDTKLCRISTDIIQDPKHVLSEVQDTRLKGPKLPMVFNLRGSFYLLHSWHNPPSTPFSGLPPFPFERLDVVGGDNAAAAAPPFSCHEVPPPPYIYTWFKKPTPISEPFPFTSYFIVDDKLVLFCRLLNAILIFTPPGEWSTLDDNIYDTEYDFLGYTGDVPNTGLFLSEFQVTDVTTGESCGVLLSLQSFYHKEDNYTKEQLAAALAGDASVKPYFCSYEVCAHAISTGTFRPKSFQKLDGVAFSDMLPHRAQNPLNMDTVSHYLLDLGEGDEEGARRVCAILTGDGYYDPISYIFVSIFDVQLIQPPPPAGSDKFLTVSRVIKKHAFRMDKEKVFQSKPVLDAFLI